MKEKLSIFEENKWFWPVEVVMLYSIIVWRMILTIQTELIPVKNIKYAFVYAAILFATIFISVLGTYFVSRYVLKELFNNSKINKQVKEIFYKSYFFYYGVYNVGYAVYLILSHRPFGKIEQNICSIILFLFISIDIYSKLKKYVVNSRKLIIFIIIIFVINSIFPIIGLIK